MSPLSLEDTDFDEPLPFDAPLSAAVDVPFGFDGPEVAVALLLDEPGMACAPDPLAVLLPPVVMPDEPLLFVLLFVLLFILLLVLLFVVLLLVELLPVAGLAVDCFRCAFCSCVFCCCCVSVMGGLLPDDAGPVAFAEDEDWELPDPWLAFGDAFGDG